ncbi:MAG: ABC transporter permease [Victivallales bacterium]|nr:ABC transporter permease [Victivallales bacterium]
MAGTHSVLRYVVRRTLYSVLVMAGVLLLTFLLFRVAAGDPARTVLGKNPSPKEVESMRMNLSSDKPLVWGDWRATETFTSVKFADERTLPGVSVAEACGYTGQALSIGAGKVALSKNLEHHDMVLRAVLTFKGSIVVRVRAADGVESEFNLDSPAWRSEALVLNPDGGPPPSGISIHAAPGHEGAMLKEVSFQRRHGSPWDSQLLASFKEIMWFTDSFPYVTFFNFGRTLITREPVRKVLIRGIWPSLALMLPIFIGELLIGVTLALFSAAFRDKWPDKIIMLFSVAGMSVSFVVFMVFGQWFLGYYFNIFPVWGFGSPRHLVLPVLIGIVSGLGGGVRFYRTIFVNELKKEYLRTAEAKGCGFTSVYFKHLLRNAAVPLITRASTVLPFLFTGSLLLESFFGIPGLGFAGINALMNSDLQMLKALVIITAMLFVSINLLADIAYAWADPRARLE